MEHYSEETQINIEPEQIERKIHALDWRDLQLWSIGAIVLAVIAAGFLAIISPAFLSQASIILNRQEDTGPLFFGLIALMILLNVYLFQQRLALLRARRELIGQLQVAERTARTDALTGVYNRRFMGEALAREVARADRNHAKLSVLFVDVDNFKDFNTRFGHVIGDRVLIDVATVLKKNFRAEDVVTRYGGDEFLIIMPDTDSAQADVAVKRLAWWISRWNDQEQRTYEITVTCGAATYAAGMDAEQLLTVADAGLYANKTAAKSVENPVVTT